MVHFTADTVLRTHDRASELQIPTSGVSTLQLQML
jgi:hypothetical protein